MEQVGQAYQRDRLEGEGLVPAVEGGQGAGAGHEGHEAVVGVLGHVVGVHLGGVEEVAPLGGGGGVAAVAGDGHFGRRQQQAGRRGEQGLAGDQPGVAQERARAQVFGAPGLAGGAPQAVGLGGGVFGVGEVEARRAQGFGGAAPAEQAGQVAGVVGVQRGVVPAFDQPAVEEDVEAQGELDGTLQQLPVEEGVGELRHEYRLAIRAGGVGGGDAEQAAARRAAGAGRVAQQAQGGADGGAVGRDPYAAGGFVVAQREGALDDAAAHLEPVAPAARVAGGDAGLAAGAAAHGLEAGQQQAGGAHVAVVHAAHHHAAAAAVGEEQAHRQRQVEPGQRAAEEGLELPRVVDGHRGVHRAALGEAD